MLPPGPNHPSQQYAHWLDDSFVTPYSSQFSRLSRYSRPSNPVSGDWANFGNFDALYDEHTMTPTFTYGPNDPGAKNEQRIQGEIDRIITSAGGEADPSKGPRSPWPTIGMAGFAGGGPVGPTDTVPALLEPGSVVLNTRAVSAFGLDNALGINALGFAEGGAAPAPPSAAPNISPTAMKDFKGAVTHQRPGRD